MRGLNILTLILLVVGGLCFRLLRDPFARLRRLGVTIAAVLALQFCLGLGNILFQFPVAVATAHNAVGALLLLTLVTLNYYLLTARAAASARPRAASTAAPVRSAEVALGSR